MLQVQFIRQNRELVLERLAVKNFADAALVVDEVLALDDQRKKLTLEYDETQAKVNSASKEIGKLMASGDKSGAESRKLEVASFKQSLGPINEQLAATEKLLHDTLVRIPNLPGADVPKGRTAEDNVEVRRGGDIPTLARGPYPTGTWQRNTTSSTLNWVIRLQAADSPSIRTREHACSVPSSPISSISIPPPDIPNSCPLSRERGFRLRYRSAPR